MKFFILVKLQNLPLKAVDVVLGPCHLLLFGCEHHGREFVHIEDPVASEVDYHLLDLIPSQGIEISTAKIWVMKTSELFEYCVKFSFSGLEQLYNLKSS